MNPNKRNAVACDQGIADPTPASEASFKFNVCLRLPLLLIIFPVISLFLITNTLKQLITPVFDGSSIITTIHIPGDENGLDTDGYHWYRICFHIYIRIRIRIRIV
jgi:hypothetical protein